MQDIKGSIFTLQQSTVLAHSYSFIASKKISIYRLKFLFQEYFSIYCLPRQNPRRHLRVPCGTCDVVKGKIPADVAHSQLTCTNIERDNREEQKGKIPEKILIFVNSAHKGSTKRSQRIYDTLSRKGLTTC